MNYSSPAAVWAGLFYALKVKVLTVMNGHTIFSNLEKYMEELINDEYNIWLQKQKGN